VVHVGWAAHQLSSDFSGFAVSDSLDWDALIDSLRAWWTVKDDLLVGGSASLVAEVESRSMGLWDEVLRFADALSDWGAALVDDVGRLLDGVVDLVADLINLGLSVEVSSHDVVGFHEGIQFSLKILVLLSQEG